MKLYRNIYVTFFPFLLFYILIIIIFKHSGYLGDEARYMMFAHNLLNGFYSPPLPEINLWNGPGYPVVIAIPLFLHLPEIFIILMNAFWLYFALILVYKTLLHFTKRKSALIGTVILGLYYPIYALLPFILTEAFAWFLVALITYLFVKYKDKNTLSIKQYLLIAISMAFLVFTKVIFAYAVLFMFVLFAILFVINTKSMFYKRYLTIFSLTMLLLLPYTVYTYSLTKQVYYWSNAGSLSLYTMSTPYPDENGGFMTPLNLVTCNNHKKEADSIINKMTAIPMDVGLRKVAIQNIKRHPGKYFKNWIANLGRLFFNYPQMNQTLNYRVVLKALPSFIILFLLFFSVYKWLKLRLKLPKSIWVLGVFFSIYLAGSSLLSTFLRMFYITLPFWLIFVGYVYGKIYDKD